MRTTPAWISRLISGVAVTLVACSGSSGPPSESDVTKALTRSNAKDIKVLGVRQKASNRCMGDNPFKDEPTGFEVAVSYVAIMEACDKVSAVERISRNCGEKSVTQNYCFEKKSGEWKATFGAAGPDWGK